MFGISTIVGVLVGFLFGAGGALLAVWGMGYFEPEEVVPPSTPPPNGNVEPPPAIEQPPPSTGGNGSGFPTDVDGNIVVPVPQPQDLQPLSNTEKKKANEIVQNSDLLQLEIQREPNPQRRLELQQTLYRLEGRRGTGIGPSAIPRKDHQNLEELWNYLQSNDIWMQRRGNRENFWMF